MSTRSLTHIEEEGKILVTFYRQFDGISGNDEGKIANGMGCLAAQVIKHFKDGVGGVYIYPAGSTDCGEEFVYTIRRVDAPSFVSPTDVGVLEPSEVCRGARDFQLHLFASTGFLKEPTDRAWNEKCEQMGIVPNAGKVS